MNFIPQKLLSVVAVITVSVDASQPVPKPLLVVMITEVPVIALGARKEPASVVSVTAAPLTRFAYMSVTVMRSVVEILPRLTGITVRLAVIVTE